MSVVHQCECGASLSNNPGAIATHLASANHREKLATKKQEDSILKYLNKQNDTKRNENKSQQSQQLSSSVQPSHPSPNSPSVIPSVPHRKCVGVIPSAITNPDEPLLLQLPIKRLSLITNRLYRISEFGVHHIKCIGLLDDPFDDSCTIKSNNKITIKSHATSS